MRNDDHMYVKQLEAARDAAEIEIKALEDEIKRCHNIMSEQQEALNPTHMGEPLINADAERWRWITRPGRTKELRIPANEDKASCDKAIDGQRFASNAGIERRHARTTEQGAEQQSQSSSSGVASELNDWLGDLLARMRGFEVDHTPDGWPAIRMRDISRLCDVIENMQEHERKLCGLLHWCESMMRPVFGNTAQLESIRELFKRGVT